MNKVKSVFSGNRLLSASVLIALVALAIWRVSPPSSSAQSTGGFGGAVVELVPVGPQTISQMLASTTAGGAFYMEGNAFLNRTVSKCQVPAGATDLVNFSEDPDKPGKRVGVWRMWGVVRKDPAASADTNSTGPGSAGQTANNISGGTVAVVNMSIDLESFNGTIQLQGTLGRVFGALESAGHPLTDILAVTGGTGTLRSASGDAQITPLTDASGTACSTLGAFQVALQESPKLPRFGNVLQF